MHYIKNVTNHEAKEAYMDCEGVFRLHFNHEPKEDKIEIGDNVLLCQRLGNEENRIFSHLVTIIDKKIYKNSYNPDYQYYIYVKLISKGTFLIHNTVYWKTIESGGYSSGKLVNIDNIGQVKDNPILKENLKKEVWGLFFPNPDDNYKEELIRRGYL